MPSALSLRGLTRKKSRLRVSELWQPNQFTLDERNTMVENQHCISYKKEDIDEKLDTVPGNGTF